MNQEMDEEQFTNEPEPPPNWPGAVAVVSFFIMIISVCGFCTWGLTVYWSNN